jgi:hypothetical protein
VLRVGKGVDLVNPGVGARVLLVPASTDADARRARRSFMVK